MEKKISAGELLDQVMFFVDNRHLYTDEECDIILKQLRKELSQNWNHLNRNK